MMHIANRQSRLQDYYVYGRQKDRSYLSYPVLLCSRRYQRGLIISQRHRWNALSTVAVYWRVCLKLSSRCLHFSTRGMFQKGKKCNSYRGVKRKKTNSKCVFYWRDALNSRQNLAIRLHPDYEDIFMRKGLHVSLIFLDSGLEHPWNEEPSTGSNSRFITYSSHSAGSPKTSIHTSHVFKVKIKG